MSEGKWAAAHARTKHDAEEPEEDNSKWGTPRDFAARLHDEFNFGLDAAAEEWSRIVIPYLGPDHPHAWRQDAFACPWANLSLSVFLNPPYGHGMARWLRKAHQEAQQGATVVCLTFARTDTAWWHERVVGRAAEVRFVQGRLKFLSSITHEPLRNKKGQTMGAPAPSVVIIYRPGFHSTRMSSMKAR